MRKHLFSALIAVSLLSTVSCSVPSTVPPATLGREFTVAIGQGVVISTENLSIKFLQVTADSRCPGDVTCIRAGEVSCLIEIGRTGVANRSRITLTQTGLTDEAGKITFDGYQLLGTVKPYPKSGSSIPAQDYRLTLTVTKL